MQRYIVEEEDVQSVEERRLINSEVNEADVIMRKYLKERKRMERVFALKFVLVLCSALVFGVTMILFYPQMPAVYVFNGVYHNASFDFTGPVPKGAIQIQFDVVLSVTNYLPITLQHMDLVMNFHSLAIGAVELSNYTLFHDTVKLPQTIVFDSRNISFEEQQAVQDLELLASDLLKGQIELNFVGEARLSIFGIPFSFEYYREAPVNWINFFVNNTASDPPKDRAQKYSLLFAPAFSNMQPASIVY